MIRFSFATLALLAMLTAGCVYHQHEAGRSEYQRTETTRTNDGNLNDADRSPGNHSSQTETTSIHRESTTTEQSGE